jgi:hypothetical protein
MLFAAQEAEVVPEQKDRVELLVGLDYRVDCSDPCVDGAAVTSYLHGERRDVDPDHVQAPLLKMKADAPRTATDVQDAAAHEAHRPTLLRPPAPERREVVGRIAREDATVIPLDDLDHTPSGGGIRQQMSERVLIGPENAQHSFKLLL